MRRRSAIGRVLLAGVPAGYSREDFGSDLHAVTTYPGVLAIRVDESLYFANTQALEALIINAVAEQPEVRHVVLICSAVDFIDTSALETLENLVSELKNAGTTLHLAEIKGPVMDGLERVAFRDKLEPGRVFLSTHEAMEALTTRRPGPD